MRVISSVSVGVLPSTGVVADCRRLFSLTWWVVLILTDVDYITLFAMNTRFTARGRNNVDNHQVVIKLLFWPV